MCQPALAGRCARPGDGGCRGRGGDSREAKENALSRGRPHAALAAAARADRPARHCKFTGVYAGSTDPSAASSAGQLCANQPGRARPWRWSSRQKSNRRGPGKAQRGSGAAQPSPPRPGRKLGPVLACRRAAAPVRLAEPYPR
jgi:hypothetical protein